MEGLEEAGLSHGETTVYTTLLKLGQSPVSELAKQTGLHRTNIYDTLEKLKEKGLVSTVIHHDKQHFIAAPPKRLLEYIDERKAHVQGLLPELERMHTQPRSDATVEIFQGKEGMKTVLKDIVREGKSYCVFEEEGYIEQVLPHYFPQFNARLDHAGINVRVLTKGQIATRKRMTARKLPEFIAFPAATAIYGDKVAIFVWDEPYHAILIRSAQVARSYRQFFDLMWEQAN